MNTAVRMHAGVCEGRFPGTSPVINTFNGVTSHENEEVGVERETCRPSR